MRFQSRNHEYHHRSVATHLDEANSMKSDDVDNCDIQASSELINTIAIARESRLNQRQSLVHGK